MEFKQVSNSLLDPYLAGGIPTGKISMIIGQSGVGKSFFMMRREKEIRNYIRKFKIDDIINSKADSRGFNIEKEEKG